MLLSVNAVDSGTNELLFPTSVEHFFLILAVSQFVALKVLRAFTTVVPGDISAILNNAYLIKYMPVDLGVKL